MEKSTISITKAKLLLYLYLICVMTHYTFNNSALEQRYIMYFAIFIGMVKIISTLKVNLKMLFVLMLISGIVAFVFLNNRETRMMLLFLSVLCALNENRNSVINILFWTKLVDIFIVIIFEGYGHINSLALHGGILLLLYICKRERHDYDNIVKIIVVSFFTAILYLYTNTGSMAVSLCAAVLLLCIKNTKIGKTILKSKIVMLIFPILLFLNYFFAAGIGEDEIPFIGGFFSEEINQLYIKLARFLDTATSFRLTLVKYSFTRLGASWLGGNVDYANLNLQRGQYFNLDSGFIWLVQGWGYLMTILLMILCVLLMWYFMKMQETNFVIVGIAIALWAINEDMLVSVGTNFLLMFIGHAVWYCFSGRKARRKENEHTENHSLLLVWK